MGAKKTIHKGSNLGPKHEGPKLDPLCLLLCYFIWIDYIMLCFCILYDIPLYGETPYKENPLYRDIPYKGKSLIKGSLKGNPLIREIP